MDGRRRRIGSARVWLVIAVLVVIFLPPFAKYQELKYKNRKLEERIVGLKVENEQLAEEKRKLETDIGYVEKKAREKIGVVRKGEIVLKEVNVKK
ncbi:MAG: septum formation initiator family protein [Candidatus Omnitrophota bacterium]